MKKMLEKFFLLLQIFIFPMPAFTKIISLPNKENPKHFLQFELSRALNRGLEKNNFLADVKYNFDFEPFLGFAGVQNGREFFDAVFCAEYAPFVFEKKHGKWSFGAGALYHFQNCAAYFRGHDFVLHALSFYKGRTNFCFFARLGCFWHLAFFPDILDFCIFRCDFLVSCAIEKIWRCGVGVFFSLGSFNDFRYPNFFCPQITAGLSYKFCKVLCASIQADFGLTDFLASPLYVNWAVFKTGLRFEF